MLVTSPGEREMTKRLDALYESAYEELERHMRVVMERHPAVTRASVGMGEAIFWFGNHYKDAVLAPALDGTQEIHDFLLRWEMLRLDVSNITLHRQEDGSIVNLKP